MVFIGIKKKTFEKIVFSFAKVVFCMLVVPPNYVEEGLVGPLIPCMGPVYPESEIYDYCQKKNADNNKVDQKDCS